MLYNLKIKTSDNESLSINDVDYIGLGNIRMDEIRPFVKSELCVRCNRGMFSFPLSDIKSIEFTIKNDNRVIMVVSNEQKKKEKNKKCQAKN